jgi:hypothetical protein
MALKFPGDFMKFRSKIVIDIMGFLSILCGLDHASGTNPVDIFDDAIGVKVVNNFQHLPIPSPQMEVVNNSSNTKEKDIIRDSLDELPDSLIWTYCFLDITPFIDSFLGDLRIIDLSSPTTDFGRRRDIKHPGFYLNPPSTGLKSEYSQAETEEFNKLLKESLGDQCRSLQAADFAFVYKFDKVIGDPDRTEFFGKAEKDGIKISVGGWLGKFASIAVFVDFTDIDSFLEKADIYFNLPPLEIEKVVIHKKNNEYLFSLEDRENMYLIRGYDTEGKCWEVLNEPGSKNRHHKVIELIKYFDKEFMP